MAGGEKKDLPKNVQEKSIFCKRLASPFLSKRIDDYKYKTCFFFLQNMKYEWQ